MNIEQQTTNTDGPIVNTTEQTVLKDKQKIKNFDYIRQLKINSKYKAKYNYYIFTA